jgi:hypothetical protein
MHNHNHFYTVFKDTGCLHACARYMISTEHRGCILSIKLHKRVTASWFWHYKILQEIVQEASITKSCVIDGLRKVHHTESQYSKTPI